MAFFHDSTFDVIHFAPLGFQCELHFFMFFLLKFKHKVEIGFHETVALFHMFTNYFFD